jgi:hypothetical protein
VEVKKGVIDAAGEAEAKVHAAGSDRLAGRLHFTQYPSSVFIPCFAIQIAVSHHPKP